MTSEASSTTTTRKRKLVDSEADEVFVLQKKQEQTVTKTVSISIPDLLEKIDDKDNKNNPIRCPIFKLGNLDFYLKVYPEDKEEKDNIGVFIHNPNNVDAKISMKVKENTIDDQITLRTIKTTEGWGWSDFMSHNAYRQWAAENGDVFKLTATVTLHPKGSSGAEEWSTLRTQSVSDPTGVIEKMCVEDGIFSDWTIISEEGQRFPCHRNILAAKSSTMKAMMTNNMKEKEEKETKFNYSNKVTGAFVDYFYKGEVPQEVLETNLSSFMKISDYYHLEPLKSQVEDAAIKSLDIENMVEMFSLANLHNAETLKRVSRYFIVENKRILGQQDLSQIPLSVMTELFKLLSQS